MHRRRYFVRQAQAFRQWSSPGHCRDSLHLHLSAAKARIAPGFKSSGPRMKVWVALCVYLLGLSAWGFFHLRGPHEQGLEPCVFEHHADGAGQRRVAPGWHVQGQHLAALDQFIERR